MKKLLFASDLDNTLLFSKRHASVGDLCVEKIHGEEQGFFTPGTVRLLQEVQRSGILFLPITTRSVEQYRRIAWPQGCAPRYAITSNGGVLLDGDREDPAWGECFRRMISGETEEIGNWQKRLSEDKRFIRCRIVDGLFLFAYVADGVDAAERALEYKSQTSLSVVFSGKKLYFFPRELNKGTAFERFRSPEVCDRTVAAGDSAIDVPLLRLADTAIVPASFPKDALSGQSVVRAICGAPFPEFVLSTVLAEREKL